MRARRIVGAGLGAVAMLAGLGLSAQAKPDLDSQILATCSSTTTRGGGWMQTEYRTVKHSYGQDRQLDVHSAPSIKFGGKTYKRTGLVMHVGKGAYPTPEHYMGKSVNRKKDLTLTEYWGIMKTRPGIDTRIVVSYESGHKVVCDVPTWMRTP